MGLNGLTDELARFNRVCIDTAIFAYHLAEHPRYVAYTSLLLTAVEQQQLEGVVTTVTLAELLTYAAQKADWETMREWELYLVNFPNLRIVSLDIAVARETAVVRAETHLKMPDAVQVAAARISGAGAIITNDHAWQKRVASPMVLVLDDFVDQARA